MVREVQLNRRRSEIILGIDPGSRQMGYAVIQKHANTLKLVVAGELKTNARHTLAEKLVEIDRCVDGIVAEYQPTALAIEGIFSHKNARSALILGHARGVAMLSAARHGLAIFEYAPTDVKQSITGRGRASKEQVQQMLQVILSHDTNGYSLDASDAIALAICHGLR